MISESALDGNYIDGLVTKCLVRALAKFGNAGSETFLRDVVPDIHNWLLSANIIFFEPKGLLSSNLNESDNTEDAHSGFLAYVNSVLSGLSVSEFPRQIKKYSYEEIELAAAILQLKFRPTDKCGTEHVEKYLHELEKRDLSQQVDQSRDHASFLMEKLTPHLLHYKKMAALPRSKRLTNVLETLALELNSHDPKVLWISLIKRIEDRDLVVREVFDSLVADESGLKNQTTLKAAPYKCVYMEGIKSGPKKGKEKYLTYQRLRHHLKKLKQEQI